ncbi:hypothetical protein F2P56_034627 [Juglans regia]|uniref:Pentatricopeptide repeat-containing protein At1g73400, mitochondrial isoform X2 n=2 Tax=Juglans regia TaxID=51240 RepID=A0A2I4EW57_JUGRE|nr:pentatricopeptide repeat-containing protein At1g73400, mitochondrial isoform X2 [Juglans regia]KAF5445584.1 hypothetical protein F2P56_034627 [Juglans regia]
MRRFCKHLSAIGFRNPSNSFSIRSFSVNPSVEPACHLADFIVSTSFLQTPCSESVKLSFPLNPLVGFVVFARRFCSEAVPIVPSLESEKEDKCLESDVDRLYNAVIDNSSAYKNMEKALDQVGVELTNELVVEVLRRLRFEEKIAFRFFTWAGHRENYAHESRAYNDMIDILSNTKYKVKQFRIVCDLLDYMKRRDKNTVPVEVLLKILRDYTEKHLTYLHKFAKKKRIRVKTQPEINAFNLLLDALCKCSLVEDAEAMFKKVKNKVKPDANTYNILFFGWCRVRNPTRGMRVLEEMIELGHTPDNFTYNTAIDTFCKAGMVTEAAELFDFMRTKGSTLSSPTAKTYAIMIVALVQNDRMEECFKLLGHMINSGCLPDVTTYKELIEGMCLAGKIEEAYKFLEEMGNKDSDGAFETWHEMDKRGCAQDMDTYSLMIDGLFRCNKVEDACSLLEDVVNKGMKLPYRMFDSFLMQLSVIGDLRAIHRLSEHMRKFYNSAMGRRIALNQKRKSMSLRGKY